MIEIKQLNKEDIRKYQHLNKDLSFCEKTKYFGIYDNNKMVGFAGLLLYKNKSIDKNIFIFPYYRGRGYFKQWLDWRLEYVRKCGIKRIEATCTAMSLSEYLKRGAQIIKQYRHYTKVVHEDI